MAASSSSHPMSGDHCTTFTDATPSQHVELWFSDGSVVLQAESTLFRVHKSQLARRSIVFSDMFTLPQPVVSTSHATFSDESHEGCPVVRLHDTAADVANLLLALYDGPCVFSPVTRTIQLMPFAERLATMTLMILLLYLEFFDYLQNTQWTRYVRKLSLTLI